jgi:hypothetical protein
MVGVLVRALFLAYIGLPSPYFLTWRKGRESRGGRGERETEREKEKKEEEEEERERGRERERERDSVFLL